MASLGGTKYRDLTLDDALKIAGREEDMSIQRKLSDRVAALATEQNTFRSLADRFDELYYTTTIGPWGPDLWADDPSATTPGRSHISVNSPAVYVDVPASLQALEPIENMLATENSDDARVAAQALERVRKAWKAEERWQLKRHKAATIKGLYGRTASYVYYDEALDRACAAVVENPRNLWMGYTGDDYTKLEWAAHITLMDPNAVREKFSVEFRARSVGPAGGFGEATEVMPWVMTPAEMAVDPPHMDLTFGPARVEVWDYWYRMPKAGVRGERGKPTEMSTWNVVIAGNAVVRGPFEYKEYKGRIPYVPVFNTFIPGTPTGRSDLHDMENLIRETMTRLTAGAQMIAKATAGDYWQLVGENAPAKGSAGVKPKLNEVVSPGGGNRIEAITPVIIQFQLEQFMTRLDREKATISGLNDMLLGLAPSGILNSSKAINALVANYESRLSMRRLLFYTWDRDTWELVVDVWVEKDDTVRQIVSAGGGTLDIIPPSLSPRDEFETAQRAINLVQNKLWSQARGMDAVGVDDPEQEQDIIRGERTDATLFPADVQTMAQLMGILQSLGLAPPPGAAAQVAGQGVSGTEALRQSLGAAPGIEGSQFGTQGTPPPIEGAGPTEGGSPFAQLQQGPVQLQGMLQNGQATSRILTNTQIPARGRR